MKLILIISIIWTLVLTQCVGQQTDSTLMLCFKFDSTYIEVNQLESLREFVDQYSSDTSFFFLIEDASNQHPIKKRKRRTLLQQCLQRENIDSNRIIIKDVDLKTNCARISRKQIQHITDYQVHPIFEWYDRYHTYSNYPKSKFPVKAAFGTTNKHVYLDIKPSSSQQISYRIFTLQNIDDLLKIYPLLKEIDLSNGVYINPTYTDNQESDDENSFIALYKTNKESNTSGLYPIDKTKTITREKCQLLQSLLESDTSTFFTYSDPPTKPTFKELDDTIQTLTMEVETLDIRIVYLKEVISKKKSPKKTTQEQRSLKNLTNQKRRLQQSIQQLKSKKQRDRQIAMEQYYRDLSEYMSHRNSTQNKFIEEENIRHNQLDNEILATKKQIKFLDEAGFDKNVIQNLLDQFSISKIPSNIWLQYPKTINDISEHYICDIKDSLDIIKSSVFTISIGEKHAVIIPVENTLSVPYIDSSKISEVCLIGYRILDFVPVKTSYKMYFDENDCYIQTQKKPPSEN